MLKFIQYVCLLFLVCSCSTRNEESVILQNETDMEKKTEKDKYMKRWIVILLPAMAVMLTVDLCAQDRQRGVEISGGTDLESG